MYYQYSENKGADQLRGYREADLRLCFRICKKPVFSRRSSFYGVMSQKDVDGITKSEGPDQTAPTQSDLGLRCLLSPVCPKT